MTPIRRLVVRLDNAGDVLLAGPAIRALAVDGPVDVLAGPAGAPAARLLPGVRDVITWRAPWILEQADRKLDRADLDDLVDTLTGRHDEAAILTSYHQSPLPAALVLRLAGIATIAATSVDHPGALLDHRIRHQPDLHEVEQQLLVAEALGATLPPGDDGNLAVDPDRIGRPADRPRDHIVLHPDASVPARSVPTALVDTVIDRLLDAGEHIVLTGGAIPDEPATADGITDLRGATDWSELAGVIRDARAIITGNTGPAHLAAAVGTPVVSIFAPVVPAHRWRPWRVPSVLLGDLDIGCAGCRSRICPLAGQPCTSGVTAAQVLDALSEITGPAGAGSRPGPTRHRSPRPATSSTGDPTTTRRTA